VLGVFVATDFDGKMKNAMDFSRVKNRDGSRGAAPRRPILADTHVRYAGEAIAMVVAETREAALDAAELVACDFDDLPVHVATALGGPTVHEEAPGNLAYDWAYGDEAEVARTFDAAAHRTRLELVDNRVMANPMEGRGVYTNTTPVDAYRGAGRPEATFVVERLVETAARQLKMDPAEFRRKNFIKSFPHQTPVIMAYDAGDYDACMVKALEMADYANLAKRKAESARKGKLRGVGFSAYIEACGIAPSKAVGSLGAGVGLWESAEVRVNPVGTVEVLTGSHSHGQGHETTFAQLVSHRLGIPIEQISIVHGDTDKVQMGMGTYGSRSGAVGMSAISKALDKVVAKATKVASRCMEVPETDVDFNDGVFSGRGTNKSMTFGEVALQAYVAHKFDSSEIEPGLKEGAFYDPKNFTFPSGVHIAEVEIDPETGITRVERWTAVDDFGVLINPMIVEGQVHGGIAQGVGQAMLEGAVYDESGQLLTGSYMDYCMPRADDLPSFNIAMSNTPCPSNPLGVKGCGEAGAIAAPAALINAITDAIGTEDIAMPATPQAVWRALQKQRRPMAAE
jgi:carbon-monoxide dehydrogenase large subunit